MPNLPRLLLLTVLALTFGCARASQESKEHESDRETKAKAAADQLINLMKGLPGHPGSEAAAMEHVKATVPGCLIHGTRTLRGTTDESMVAVDVTLQASQAATRQGRTTPPESRRRNVNVLLRWFTSPEGKNYWGAETVRPERLQSEGMTPTKAPNDPEFDVLLGMLEEAATRQSPTSRAQAAREAAIGHARAILPGCVIRGTASSSYRREVYLVAVDVSAAASQAAGSQAPRPVVGSGRQTLNVIVRAFKSPGGTSYWKAEPFTPDPARLLLE
jgi:hypothetical protein